MSDELLCSGVEFFGLGRELLEAGHSLRCEVRGRSMFPFLRDGDVIQVAPSGIDGLLVGDIIFYRSGDRLLAHRVVGFVDTPKGLCARARGDAFVHEDPLITDKDLIGKIELASRQSRGGWQEIRLNRGWTGLLGILVARSRFFHWLVRWLSLGWFRLVGVGRKLLRVTEIHRCGRGSDVENEKL